MTLEQGINKYYSEVYGESAFNSGRDILAALNDIASKNGGDRELDVGRAIYTALKNAVGETPGLLEKPVTFIDYDGTVLYSYTKEEASRLTELPPNPEHEGLISQGWNYSLEEFQAQIDAAGLCTVGQMYITDDGRTRIKIQMSDVDSLTCTIGLYIRPTLSWLKFYWGDGQTSFYSDLSQATTREFYHTYDDTGEYNIEVEIVGSGNIDFYFPESAIDVKIGDKINSTKSFVGRSSQMSGLETITLPNGITRLEQKAFYKCQRLKSITIPSSSGLPGPGISDSMGQTFVDCISLRSISIPPSQGIPFAINESLFYRCANLSSVSVPIGCIYIAKTIFDYCYNLEFITIPDGVTSIGNQAFSFCCSLKNINIPDSVTSIGEGAFSNCYSLKSIVIPDEVTSIGSSAFSNCYFLESVNIPDGVTSIGQNTFYLCRSLRSINIPDGVTSIGQQAFSGCSLLRSIDIPDGVTSIGTRAFDSCWSIESIDIPDSVTSLGQYLFYNCFALQSITIHWIENPPEISSNSMGYFPRTYVIYIPQGTLEMYRNDASWGAYAGHMVEVEPDENGQ